MIDDSANIGRQMTPGALFFPRKKPPAQGIRDTPSGASPRGRADFGAAECRRPASAKSQRGEGSCPRRKDGPTQRIHYADFLKHSRQAWAGRPAYRPL
jgi:hypothetical protein